MDALFAFPSRSGQRLVLAVMISTALAAVSTPSAAQVVVGVPAALLSHAEGSVAVAPKGDSEWTDVKPRRALRHGDRVWTDRGSRAELMAGAHALRLDGLTQVALESVGDGGTQLSVLRGSLALSVAKLGPGENVEVGTPNLALRMRQGGDLRIDVDPQQGTTRVSVMSGAAVVYGEHGEAVDVASGQRLTFRERNLAKAPTPAFTAIDDFDRWIVARGRAPVPTVLPPAPTVHPDAIARRYREQEAQRQEQVRRELAELKAARNRQPQRPAVAAVQPQRPAVAAAVARVEEAPRIVQVPREVPREVQREVPRATDEARLAAARRAEEERLATARRVEEERRVALARRAQEEQRALQARKADDERRAAQIQAQAHAQAKRAQEERRVAPLQAKRAEEERRLGHAKRADDLKRVALAKKAEDQKRLALAAKKADQDRRLALAKKAEQDKRVAQSKREQQQAQAAGEARRAQLARLQEQASREEQASQQQRALREEQQRRQEQARRDEEARREEQARRDDELRREAWERRQRAQAEQWRRDHDVWLRTQQPVLQPVPVRPIPQGVPARRVS